MSWDLIKLFFILFFRDFRVSSCVFFPPIISCCSISYVISFRVNRALLLLRLCHAVWPAWGWMVLQTPHGAHFVCFLVGSVMNLIHPEMTDPTQCRAISLFPTPFTSVFILLTNWLSKWSMFPQRGRVYIVSASWGTADREIGTVPPEQEFTCRLITPHRLYGFIFNMFSFIKFGIIIWQEFYFIGY